MTIPSQQFEISRENGLTLYLRQWFGALDAETSGPALLLVHGLGGRSEWMGDFAEHLLKAHSRVYGIDIAAIGKNPSQEGSITDYRHLVLEVHEAVNYLADTLNTPVYAVGLSLGGLIVSYLAARPPEGLRGIILLSPAFKAAKESFNPMFYVKVLSRYFLEKMRVLAPKPIPLPYSKDHRLVTRNQEKAKLIYQTEDRVMRLSAHAYVELLKMTILHTPRILSQIHVPTLLIMAEKDGICDSLAMISAFDQFPATEKHKLVLKEACHDLVLEPELPEIADEIVQWITRLESSPRLLDQNVNQVGG